MKKNFFKIILFLCFVFPAYSQDELVPQKKILEQKVSVHFKPEKAVLVYEDALGSFLFAPASVQEASEEGSYLVASSLEDLSLAELQHSFFISAEPDLFAATEVSTKEVVGVAKENDNLDQYEKELSELEGSLEIQRDNLVKLEQNIEILNERIAAMTGTKSVADLEKAVEKKEIYKERKRNEVRRIRALVENAPEIADPRDIDKRRVELQNQLKEASILTANAYLEKGKSVRLSTQRVAPKKISLFHIQALEEDLRRLQKKRLVLEEALR